MSIAIINEERYTEKEMLFVLCLLSAKVPVQNDFAIILYEYYKQY